MKVKSEREVAQSCPTLCDPMDCSLSGSSVQGIFQSRVLEWAAIAFSGVPVGRAGKIKVEKKESGPGICLYSLATRQVHSLLFLLNHVLIKGNMYMYIF